MKKTKKLITLLVSIFLISFCFVISVGAKTTIQDNDSFDVNNVSVAELADSVTYTYYIGNEEAEKYSVSLGFSSDVEQAILSSIEDIKSGEATLDDFSAKISTEYMKSKAAEEEMFPFGLTERQKTKTFTYELFLEEILFYKAEVTVTGNYSSYDKSAVITNITIVETGELVEAFEYNIDMSNRFSGEATVTFSSDLLFGGDFLIVDYKLSTNGNLSSTPNWLLE